MSTTQTAALPAFEVELSTPQLPKGEQEHQAFLRLLPQLLLTDEGKYVAIHNGQVVDRDTDEVALILRVQAKVGYVPVFVGLVTAAQPVLRIPHYHAERSQGTPWSATAEVHIHDLPPLFTRAVLGEKEPHILLGRDVLNAHRVVLDGPGLALEIERPAGPHARAATSPSGG